ncbi:hypothetical protein BDW62DRAFT_214219 [Aspergillus aurantiobrunneus]
MSSYSDSQSQHSNVPPSAQPYRSLFGGSSQGTLDQDRYSRFEEDDFLDQFNRQATASGGPNAEYDDPDDDLAYIQTSERETSSSPRKEYIGTRKLPATYANSSLKARESPESSTSPPPYRPNRFHGPAHLWLNLTRHDREIVESLEEIGARDLAAHLYNAHILQSQGFAKLAGGHTDQSNQGGPQGPETDANDLLSNLEEWTAWPMSSDEVPRASERLRRLEHDRWTFRMKPDPRPSAELEECITAFLLKKAKERFQSREWGSPTLPERKGTTKSDTDGSRSGAEGYLEDGQRSAGDGVPTEGKSEQESQGSPLRPVFQIDDDESRRKLRSLVRNTISQFEDLLMGLHRFHGALQLNDGRSNRSRSRGRKRARSSSLTSNTSSIYSRNTPKEDDSEAERLTETDNKSRSRGRKRTRRTSQSSQQSIVHAGSAHTSRHRERSISTNSNGQTGLTNWRDVVGIASMIGLPPVVLRRATQRFATLVGEEMEFPTISENPGRHFMESILEWTSTQNDLATLKSAIYPHLVLLLLENALLRRLVRHCLPGITVQRTGRPWCVPSRNAVAIRKVFLDDGI